MAEPVTEYSISPHAMFEMDRRGIGETIVRRVLGAPEQRRSTRPGRDVLQSRIEIGGNVYLVRVFVDVYRRPAEVVTVYRTSKIGTYWEIDS